MVVAASALSRIKLAGASKCGPDGIPRGRRAHRRCRHAAGATLAPVSGLVFCYACLVTRVRQAGKCPVTGAPLKEDQLVRIFLPER